MSEATTFETLTLQRQNGMATLRIDRGGSLNAINQKMIRELNAAVAILASDLDILAVVVTGTDHAFSAGIDLNDPEKWRDEDLPLEKRRELAFRGARLCQAIETLPQITIAAIHGPAIGAGAAITLACDWRVMAPYAYFWLPEIKIGMNLSWGAVPRLTTLVGPARAKRMLILCEKLDADHAVKWGLADEVSEDPVTCATEMALIVAAMPPTPVIMSKEAVNATANALHRATAYADSDQGLMCRDSSSARKARSNFQKNKDMSGQIKC